jgi:hypothetical protein
MPKKGKGKGKQAKPAMGAARAGKSVRRARNASGGKVGARGRKGGARGKGINYAPRKIKK